MRYFRSELFRPLNEFCTVQDPRDVVWDHVNIGHIQRAIRKTIIYAVFAAMIIFWMVPGMVPL